MAIRLSASETEFVNPPTFYQWKKELEELPTKEFRIVKVLWNKNYKSITFYTDEFRYSIKLESEEAFDKQVRSLKTQMCKYCFAVVQVSPESHGVFIDKVTESASDWQQFTWEEWGLVLKKSSK